MLLQFILLFNAQTVDLSSLPDLEEFKEQCHPKWGSVDSPFKLSQLIVVFRHGSRAPLKMRGSEWEHKQCETCSAGCKTQACEEGLLTLEGFDQSKKLGRFINKFYVPKFSSLQGIRGFYSKIERTFTTLNGVIQGIGIPNYSIAMEPSLINNPNSTQVKTILSNRDGMETEKNGQGNYYIYDNMVTSMCSGVLFDCTSFSCDPKKIYKFMKSQEAQFIESMEKIRTNLTANGVSLGKFGSFLEEILSGRNNIALISGHDSTLIKLLIGLGIKLDRIPAYSSAVFLEVWKQPGGKEFVRVVYNGKTQKIGLYREEYVEFDQFIKYLAMFNKLNDVLDNNTDINSESVKPPHKLNEMAQSATRIYKPLLTELKNRDIIHNSSLISEEIVESPKTGLKRTLSNLVAPMKQFLFGGWFGGSKKDKKAKTEIKVMEIKNKDTGQTNYQIIECDKDGKKNCRAISNDGDKDKGKPAGSEKQDSCKSEDSKSKRQESCACGASKSNKCESEKETSCGCSSKKIDRCDMEKESVSPSCQVKAMLENSCGTEETSCEAKKAPCESGPKSAFDGLPGTCKMFSNSNCEALNPPIPPAPCIKNQSPTLPDGRCRNPIPGVEMLD